MLAILDYKAGNQTSVLRALRALGVPAEITADPSTILSAEGVIFPGVGAAGQAMAQEVARYRNDKTLRAKKAQERKNLTPAAQLQPKARELRYENIRSARAEEGIIRLALLEPPLLDQLVDLGPESFSSPLLAKLFVLLRQRHSQGLSLQPGALSAALSPEEMSHLAGILEEPQSMANSGQALRDYLTIIRTEAAKRGGTGQDPLLAVRDKLREKKSYGGQPHE